MGGRCRLLGAAVRLLAVVALAHWLTAHGGLRAAESVPRRPNVLLIMVDDMGWSDLGCYGSEIQTPSLDRLAARGLRFTQFYNTAKCAETRSSLLSGIYHLEVGIGALRNCWTIADAMASAGYFTAMTGKWHLSKQPTARGFERYFGHLSSHTDYFTGDETFRINDQPFKVPLTGFYTTDANTDYAMRFIDESMGTGKPFFCYIAYNAPHTPLQAPKEDVDKYRGRYMIGWDKIREQRYARQQQLGLLRDGWALSPRPADVPAWDGLSSERKALQDLRMATFAAAVDRVDQNIGRLVAHLEKLRVLDDTLVIFLSDNGANPFDLNEKHPDRSNSKMPWEPGSYWSYDKGWAHVCNTPFREYKRNQHEGGISTPLIVHWPNGLKTAPGEITYQVGHVVDMMPTLLDLTDTEYPATFRGETLKPLRGKSLLPILAGKQREPSEALFFEFRGVNRAVRTGAWKLVSKDRGRWELYNIEEDRSEQHDLSSEQSDRVERMRKAWEAWAAQAKGGGAETSEAPNND